MFGKRSTASDLLLDRPAKAAEVAVAESAAPRRADAARPTVASRLRRPPGGGRPTNITI